MTINKRSQGLTSFSVVIPAYNASKKIQDLIESLNKQTHDDFEVIIIDDCSSDFKELLLYVTKNLKRKHIIRQLDTHKNGAAARNLGIDLSSLDYIAFADADDHWDTHKLEHISNHIKQNKNTTFAYHKLTLKKERGGEFEYPKRGIKTSEDILEYLFCEDGLIQTSSIICRRASLGESIRFDESLNRHQDWDFVLNIYNAGFHFDYIDKVLGVWNIAYSLGSKRRDFHINSMKWADSNKASFTHRALIGFNISVLIPRLVIERKYLSATSLYLKSFASMPASTIQITARYVNRIVKKLFS